MIQAAAGALSPPQKRGNPDSYHTAKASKSSKNHPANNSKSEANNQLSFAIVRQAAHGKWESIHRALGIQLVSTSHAKHTTCQGCGGKDRFRVMADYGNTGKWFCGGGGDQQSGDGFSLLGHVFGWNPQEQLKAVADYLGLSTLDNKERDKIRAIAEKQAKDLQAAIAKKDEQARNDSNVLTMLENLIDEIHHRQYLQRQAVRFNGAYLAEPSIHEVNTAQELNEAILEAYAHKSGVDYV